MILIQLLFSARIGPRSMETFPLVTEPTPSLRERSQEVALSEVTTADFQHFIDALARTMFKEDGIGIASPQVGKNIRVIIVNLKEGPTAFINPELIKRSDATAEGEEACLSVPGRSGIVTRHKRVTVRAVNRFGRRVEIEANGLMSVVFQHEIDHLDGILYIDRATKVVDYRTTRAL